MKHIRKYLHNEGLIYHNEREQNKRQNKRTMSMKGGRNFDETRDWNRDFLIPVQVKK